MSVKQRLKEFIHAIGTNDRQFTISIGVSPGYINSISKSIQPEKLNRISAQYPRLNIEWLLTGEGEMMRQTRGEGEPHASPKVFMAPLVGKYAYAGYISGYGDDEYVETLPTVPFIIPDDHTPRGEYRCIEVRGDSMDDGTAESIRDGDMLLCRIIKQELWHDYKLHLKKWNFVIVHRDGILVKRIVGHDLQRHTITIHSLNEMYSDEILEMGDVMQVMNVVQLTRRPAF